MKKIFKLYIIVWLLCLVIFNVITFAIPNEFDSISRFSGSFWIGYIFISISFVGQLICAYVAFRAETPKKLFYKIPLLLISYAGLAVMLVAGGLTMAIPNFPNWIGIIVCVLVLCVTIISVIKSTIATDIVSDIDEKTTSRTAFIRTITGDAQNLISRANAPMLKEQCKKVYEALRYSDPMSNPSLSDVEQRIKEEFDSLSDAIIADDLDLAESSVKTLKALIAERNDKCKMLK